MKRRHCVILSILVFFSCGAVPRGSKDQQTVVPAPGVEDYLGNEAVYYYSEGIKSAATGQGSPMDSYLLAIKADSGYAQAYYQMAELMLENDPTKALEYSRRAVAADTLNLTYLSQLGRTLIYNGDYNEAMNIYSELMRKDAHDPVNYSMLAALYEYNKQPFTAISILDSAELKVGRIEELSAYKRQLLISVRLYDKAINETKALIADYPYDNTNYVVLGDLYAAMGKDSLAAVNYKEALRIDSTNVVTLLSVADFYKNSGDDRSYLAVIKRVFESDDLTVDQKLSMFNEITRSIEYYRNNFFSINSLALTLFIEYPTDYRVIDMYATHLLRSGEIEGAVDLYKSYLAINSDTLPPYHAILDIEAYLQRPDSVTKYSDMAIKRFPDDQELYMRKGFALDYMEKPKDAVSVYKQALKKTDSDSVKSVIMGIIGDTYHKMEQPKKSYSSYDKALAYDPHNYGVLNNYAYYLSEENDRLEDALAMSSRANELNPSNATFLDTQAWVYYKMGRYEDARKLMIQAVALDRTGSEVLLLHYGDILFELGDVFMAKIYWKRALERGAEAALIEERLKWLDK